MQWPIVAGHDLCVSAVRSEARMREKYLRTLKDDRGDSGQQPDYGEALSISVKWRMFGVTRPELTTNVQPELQK